MRIGPVGLSVVAVVALSIAVVAGTAREFIAAKLAERDARLARVGQSRYLVEPKQAGRVKTRLLQELLSSLNAQPERALFPKGNMR